jgi:hypothetical protein
MSRQTDLEHTRRANRTAEESLVETEVESSLAEEHETGTNLDKIRDILFGAQVRDHECRFTKLEAQLLAEAAQLQNDLKERFASLEQHIRKEKEPVPVRSKTTRDSSRRHRAASYSWMRSATFPTMSRPASFESCRRGK